MYLFSQVLTEFYRLMHRRYTAEQYINLVKKLREARPTVHISSDFIVGFPGETDEDFEETMKVVNEVKFDQSFSLCTQ